MGAMAMDAGARDRSRSSSGSPPPFRRHLMGSSSAPRLGLGEELPPLRPDLSIGGPGRTRGTALGQSNSMRSHGLHRVPARVLVKDDETSWRPPVSIKGGLGKGVGNAAGGGIAGWTLSGHSPEGSQGDTIKFSGPGDTIKFSGTTS